MRKVTDRLVGRIVLTVRAKRKEERHVIED